MFLETSRPKSPGWKARLVSKYVGLRVACLKFWYHAFGDDAHIGELQLVVKTSLVGKISFERFESSLNVNSKTFLSKVIPLHENYKFIPELLDLWKETTDTNKPNRRHSF